MDESEDMGELYYRLHQEAERLRAEKKMSETKTRKTSDGDREYFCPNCQAWTTGAILELTGYSAIVCDGCDTTLKDDIYGFNDIENE